MALLSLFSGLRVGERLALTWADVNLDEGTIFVKDTKNKHNRHAYITAEIWDILIRHQSADKLKSALVFGCNSRSERYTLVRKDFTLAVISDLGLNEGVSDQRQKVVVHTLRHTFAFWLVRIGTPLYTVSKLVGHSTLRMTERYTHLALDTQKGAAMELEGMLGGKGRQQ